LARVSDTGGTTPDRDVVCRVHNELGAAREGTRSAPQDEIATRQTNFDARRHSAHSRKLVGKLEGKTLLPPFSLFLLIEARNRFPSRTRGSPISAIAMRVCRPIAFYLGDAFLREDQRESTSAKFFAFSESAREKRTRLVGHSRRITEAIPRGTRVRAEDKRYLDTAATS